MKPRLEPSDHTEDDAFVWAHVVLEAPGPARFGSTLWTRSLMQDRRDADLMLDIAICRGHPAGEFKGLLGFEHPMPSLRRVERYFPHRKWAL